ncbi:uroporphyrinogen-III C-methyltransferase [Bacillus suaedae]|uniref:Uroporphyrinogen-III C-methyltransferase n=1 Tax=Halalkalibacter suaedae TaxID=2822140 RepID=A0A940WVT1_9BACI|nr:uroporphyrinogen-III C-methyltransferase [Bacillus suaedae]MBP3953330.1 uroporphyrinogen-III C-methyltransferase [Bacillus suaedae]
MQKGIVYFVGAGPGDPELLTIKGRRVLREADVVVFDRLVNPILLTEVKSDAKLVYCGKQPCQHFLRQEDIQKELLIHARKGKKVVRLKGGDPAVFGRVGEEAELLSDNKIDYEIVPGITAGIAAPAYAGATITHREHSRSFAVVSGHSKTKDGKPDIKWESLAGSVDTIVFYMGVKHLQLIADQLINHGKPQDTAVLVIQWGTLSRQRTIDGTLKTIARKVKQAELTNPAIIVVGDVVKLRKKLQWFDQRSLSGKGILFPTSDPAQQLIVSELKREGADVYQHPRLTQRSLIKETPFKERWKDLNSCAELVFLSDASVDHFIEAINEYDCDLREIHSVFYSNKDSTRDRLLQIGCRSKEFHSAKKLINPLFVGSELDMKSIDLVDVHKVNHLFTHEDIVSEGEIQAFNRLVEEEHADTLILSSKTHALKFLNFLKKGIVSREGLSKLSILCQADAVKVLGNEGIHPDVVFEDVGNMTQLMTQLTGRLLLAQES